MTGLRLVAGNGAVIKFSNHAIKDRMALRGITFEDVKLTVENGTWYLEKPKKYLIIYDKFVVVVGEIVPCKLYFAVTVIYEWKYRRKAFKNAEAWGVGEYEALRMMRSMELWGKEKLIDKNGRELKLSSHALVSMALKGVTLEDIKETITNGYRQRNKIFYNRFKVVLDRNSQKIVNVDYTNPYKGQIWNYARRWKLDENTASRELRAIELWTEKLQYELYENYQTV